MNKQPQQLVWQGYTSNSDSVCVYKYKQGNKFKYNLTVKDIGGHIVLSVQYEKFWAAERRAIKLCK